MKLQNLSGTTVVSVIQRQSRSPAISGQDTVADGGNQEEGSHQKILCQYDHRYPTASDELCGVAGFYQGHL